MINYHEPRKARMHPLDKAVKISAIAANVAAIVLAMMALSYLRANQIPSFPTSEPSHTSSSQSGG